MALTWNREESGSYASTNGRWRVLNKGRDWRLIDRHDGDEEILLARQKKICQDKAESIEEGHDKIHKATNAKPTKTPPGKRPPPCRTGKPEPAKQAPNTKALTKVVEKQRDVGSSLSSLYLEISGLRFSLERTIVSVKNVEDALQRIVDPDKEIPRP